MDGSGQGLSWSQQVEKSWVPVNLSAGPLLVQLVPYHSQLLPNGSYSTLIDPKE